MGTRFEWAPQAYRALNGVFCVHKPAGLHINHVLEILKVKLAEGLNKLPCYRYERKPRPRASGVENGGSSSLPVPTTVPADMEDLSDHRLVLGPRYIPADIRLYAVPSRLAKHASGVQVIGVGKGITDALMIRDSRFIRAYHVTGRLGMATHDFTPYGNILQRTSYHHVRKAMVDKVCAASQASHAKHLFEYARVDVQSQEAYEMASRGIIRPKTTDTPPLLYGIRCIAFDLPYFTLEIHAVNENATYFLNFVHDMGLAVRSTAVCSKILRLRYGHFTLTHALLRKHWTLEHILESLKLCRSNLEVDKLFPNEFITDDKKYLPESKEKRSGLLALGQGEVTGS